MPVVAKELHVGAGHRHWSLTLACGHVVARRVDRGRDGFPLPSWNSARCASCTNADLPDPTATGSAA